jgi:hypothetical protein
MDLDQDTQSYFTRAFEDDVFGPSVNCPPLKKDQKIQKVMWIPADCAAGRIG